MRISLQTLLCPNIEIMLLEMRDGKKNVWTVNHWQRNHDDESCIWSPVVRRMCCFLSFSHVGGPGHDTWRWWSYQSNTEHSSWSHGPGLRPRPQSYFLGPAASQGVLVSDLLSKTDCTWTQLELKTIHCLDKCLCHESNTVPLLFIVTVESLTDLRSVGFLLSSNCRFDKQQPCSFLSISHFFPETNPIWLAKIQPLSCFIQSNPSFLLNLKLFLPPRKAGGPGMSFVRGGPTPVVWGKCCLPRRIYKL